MDYIFLTGLIGSLVLVTGAAWDDAWGKNRKKKPSKHPALSTKNWLFAIGGLIMLLYATLGWLNAGPVFFVFLEILVVVASVMMMLAVDDRIDTVVISVLGLAFIVWSLYLFEGYNTVFFILGLSGIGLGYAFDNGTLRRDIALTAGSLLIALFSFIEASWIFFWLNVFFAIFSGYYLIRGLRSGKK
jgi:hypothetical protein